MKEELDDELIIDPVPHVVTSNNDCGDTMKEKLDDELIIYPVPHVVTSLDEPVTCNEFFV